MMVAATYGVARVPAAPAPTKAAEHAAARKSFFARALEALMEARMQQAQREIAKHIHLLPYSLDERGNRLVKTGARDMPFGGW